LKREIAMIRRFAIIGIVAGGLAAQAPAFAAQGSQPDPEVLAVVDAALDAAKAGDISKLRQQYTADCTFEDEFAPFLWSGEGALDAYLQSAAQMYQETRHGNVVMTRGAPKFSYVSQDRAYVVEPLTEASSIAGKPYESAGTLTMVLVKAAGVWKIKAQTWTKTSETLNPY
jgi:ketosteroid isomerase-like protein